jgi:cytidylate kinase
MEGRDIGTVVFPGATVKIFLDAAPEVRARRRLDELHAKGQTALTFEAVLNDINERDHRDRNRGEAPLMQAPDAEYVDSSGQSIEQVEERLLALVRARTSNGKEIAK